MPESMSPQDALQALLEGNARFVAGRRDHPHEFLTRAYETAQAGQNPIAVILSCSDSRVPLEIVFDQGVGDLFAIRVAGNVCGPCVVGSIDFAVESTQPPLCVVLGHTRCGAVTAACRCEKRNNNVDSLITAIEPAVGRVIRNADARANRTEQEFIDECCRENVFLQMESIIRQSSVVRRAVRENQLLVIGAIYDIENGTVTFLGPLPELNELLA